MPAPASIPEADRECPPSRRYPLQVKPRIMLTQPGESSRLCFFTRTDFGTSRLNTPPADTPSTTCGPAAAQVKSTVGYP
jgi:hypothetical protein